MSCNGCRVLRKACADNCILRTCLTWIPNPEAQGNATLFLAKFFGRSDLLSLIAAVPESQRDAMFRSLLFEACGRTVNPINGAVGLLSTGNWQVCQNAVSTVLGGGTLHPLPETHGNDSAAPPISAFNTVRAQTLSLRRQFHKQSNLVGHDPSPHSERVAINSPSSFRTKTRGNRSHLMENWPLKTTSSTWSEMSEMVTVESSGCDRDSNGGGRQEIKLLNLFI